MVSEIQRLEEELAQARTELHAENQRGALKDSNKVAELEAKMADLSQQIEVEQRLADNKQEHEQRIEESQQEIAYILDTLKAGDNTMRDLTLNEEAYQILREVFQISMMELDEKRLEEVSKLKNEISALTASKDSLQQQYDKLYENYAEVKAELNTATTWLSDTEYKRDAAVRQLEECQQEVKRLNSHIDDLRAEMALGAKEAVKVTNVGGSMDELVQKFNASKRAIYNVTYLDTKRSRCGFNYADTGEYDEENSMYMGKFREVTAEEAEVFRAEYEARQDQESVQVDNGSGLELTPESFQEEDTVNGLAGDETVQEDGRVTIEERVAALEKAVFSHVNNALAILANRTGGQISEKELNGTKEVA